MKRMIHLFFLLFSLTLMAPAYAQDARDVAVEPTNDAIPPADGDPVGSTKPPKYDSNDPKFRDIAKEFRCPTCT
ncbi:MAG: hypothetical protein EOP10_28910, partial [Proteobacteria bacterium]